MLDLVLPFPQQSRFIREALEHGLAIVQLGEMGSQDGHPIGMGTAQGMAQWIRM
jgi:hypothetical protein